MADVIKDRRPLLERMKDYRREPKAEALLKEAVAEIKRLEVELSAARFWSSGWTFPDGMTAEQALTELTDYHMLLTHVPVVYEVITGGRVSKPNTTKEAVLAEYEDHVQTLIDDALMDREDVQDLAGPTPGEGNLEGRSD